MSVLQRMFVPNESAAPSALVVGPPRRLRGNGTLWIATAFALVLGLLWARYLSGVNADSAAQWAWADFAAKHPDSAYDLAWYGGIHPASYSLLTPYLMALIGVPAAAVAASTVSTALLAVLVTRSSVHRPLPVALWGAFALTCNVAAGRATFALGCMFGLAALVAARTAGGAATAGTARSLGWQRTAAVAAFSLLATASSPVAGLFVEVAAAAMLLTGRRRTGWALAVPPPLVVLFTTVLFPFDGVDPISVSTVVICLLCSLAVALLGPASWREVRIGAGVYGLGSVLTWVFDTPIGGNVQRLALIFGGVLLLAALCARPKRSRRQLAALLVVFVASGFWTVKADIIGIPDRSPAGQGTALIAELDRLHADRARIEAVPMLNHWESWGLVRAAELARGWNRQLDVQRNPFFYDHTLDPTNYHDWLRRWSVAYVALPTGPVDSGGVEEAALLRTAPPDYLQEVWRDDNWRLFRFTDAVPLAAAPVTVERAGSAEVVLTVPTAGPVDVRIPWSPWLTAHGPAGACLTRDGDWIRLTAPTPGTYRIGTGYSWPRGTPC
ncbi:hypothetical protein GCM10009665_44710 [Kitasatospora nipponensis]|uniref:MFS transporter n=1 Tax=Kitasatospora nipponensis TaxID=258049 RepID=A0ABP4H473_9ACTN